MVNGELVRDENCASFKGVKLSNEKLLMFVLLETSLNKAEKNHDKGRPHKLVARQQKIEHLNEIHSPMKRTEIAGCC